jgi:cyclic pyranopterin phosphate synthase
MGIDKIRLTGGEPLVRMGIVDLVSMIASVHGVKDLGMTSNGVLLEKYAGRLKDAGLHRINISLDTLNPATFKTISRGGDLQQVLKGIDAALKAGLHPVKINCVVFDSSKGEDALRIREYAGKNNLQVRFIRQMDLKTGRFSVVEGGEGGNCMICNRLRITANGLIKPCLFSEQEFPVRILGPEQAILKALNEKPLKGCFNTTGSFYNIGG